MSEFLVNLANGKTDEKGIFRFLGKLFNQSGVIESTALTVTAQSSPDMTVKVSGSVNADSVVFQNSNGDFYGGWNTANYNVTITANASGGTKTDAIVAYADTAAGSSTANNPGGLKIIAVRGASGTTTDAEISTVISNKPFLRLANVTVGNGVSSINSGNIADARTFAGLSGLSSPWTSYTPTWDNTGTANTLGAGTIVGRYSKVGRTVQYALRLTFGSGTVSGNNTWTFTLPFASANQICFYSSCGDAVRPTVTESFLMVNIASNVTTITPQLTSNAVSISGTIPFTWVSGDYLYVSGTYESAT